MFMKGVISTNKTTSAISDSYISTNKTINSLLWDEKDLHANQEFIRHCIHHRNNNIKYNGKYAFIRIFYAQEIISSSFSLLTALSAVLAIFLAHRIVRPSNLKITSNQPRHFTALISTLAIHAMTWTGSCIFHVRDCYTTQCIDYFGAILSISSTLLLSFRRLNIPTTLLTRILTVFIPVHVLYMHFIHFNFLYNSIICGVLFLSNTAIWLFWYSRIDHLPYSRLLRLSILGTACAASFQVVDFGPVYFLLDSHALWHILAWIFTSTLYVFFLVDLHVLTHQK